MSRPWPPPRVLGPWVVLGALLLVNLVAALTLDRGRWPGLVGDEATYAMQAESVAWDFDLSYDRQDYDRFLGHHGQVPEGLILQSRDHGESLTFSKPFLYGAFIAPFARLAPVRGAAVANALLLTLMALYVARVLSRRQGSAAPLWVAVYLFASVAFAYTYWIHADLFLMCAVALGYALAQSGSDRSPEGALPEVFGGSDEPAARWWWLRWVAVGALLGIPGAFRPFYLSLLVPVLLLVPSRRRWPARLAVAAGAVALLALTSGVQWASGGNWSSYGSERQGFYVRTGFPDVEFPRTAWDDSLARWGNTSWIHEEMFDVVLDGSLLAWNTAYFLVGQNVGVLVYFMPLVFGLLGSWSRMRWWTLGAVLLAVLCFFLFRPFNFYGGAGAIANRYFLPLYPALWFGATGRSRASLALVAAVAAAPLVLPLWLAPRAFPVELEGGYHHVSAIAERVLPYETTQSHLPRKHEDVLHNGLWLRFENDAVWPVQGGQGLRLLGQAEGRLLVGSERPLSQLELQFGATATPHLEAGGGELGSWLMRPDGRVAVVLQLGEPRALHPMWWTREPFYLYAVTLRLPDAPPRPVRLDMTGT